MKKVTLTALDKSLRSRIALDRKTGCWEWTGSFQDSIRGRHKTKGVGRPILLVGGKPKSAARLTWETFEDDDLPRMTVVANQCQNKKCVNPKHHKLSTYQEMMRAIRERNPMLRKDPNLCTRGHDLTAPGAFWVNNQGKKICRTCDFIRETQKWRMPSERRSATK